MKSWSDIIIKNKLLPWTKLVDFYRVLLALTSSMLTLNKALDQDGLWLVEPGVMWPCPPLWLVQLLRAVLWLAAVTVLPAIGEKLVVEGTRLTCGQTETFWAEMPGPWHLQLLAYICTQNVFFWILEQFWKFSTVCYQWSLKVLPNKWCWKLVEKKKTFPYFIDVSWKNCRFLQKFLVLCSSV